MRQWRTILGALVLLLTLAVAASADIYRSSGTTRASLMQSRLNTVEPSHSVHSDSIPQWIRAGANKTFMRYFPLAMKTKEGQEALIRNVQRDIYNAEHGKHLRAHTAASDSFRKEDAGAVWTWVSTACGGDSTCEMDSLILLDAEGNTDAGALLAFFSYEQDVDSTGTEAIAAADCYHSLSHKVQWKVPVVGFVLASITKSVGSWCGSNGRITVVPSHSHSSYTWGPQCLTNESQDQSWDIYPSWIHDGYWATMGTGIKGICEGYSEKHSVIRIAWNGYHDNYDDYGY